VVAQLGLLKQKVPQELHDLQGRAGSLPLIGSALHDMPALGQLLASRPGLFGKITGVLSLGFDVGIQAFSVIALGAYLAARPELYVRGVARLFSPRYRARIAGAMGELGVTLGWWLTGKGMSMALIGALNGTGLWLLGVPAPIALGLITMFFTFIPNFGPLLSLLPAALLALTIQPMLAVYVTLLHFGIQFVESYLVTPLIQQRTVALPPALTLGVQLLAGVLAGPLGLVLAAPLAAVGMVLVHRFVPWEKRSSTPGGPASGSEPAHEKIRQREAHEEREVEGGDQRDDDDHRGRPEKPHEHHDHQQRLGDRDGQVDREVEAAERDEGASARNREQDEEADPRQQVRAHGGRLHVRDTR
jgi:predicted PurR-regulated permease PerM